MALTDVDCVELIAMARSRARCIPDGRLRDRSRQSTERPSRSRPACFRRRDWAAPATV